MTYVMCAQMAPKYKSGTCVPRKNVFVYQLYCFCQALMFIPLLFAIITYILVLKNEFLKLIGSVDFVC